MKGISNALAVFGAYGISLAEFTGAVDLPLWVGVLSALAGTVLTGTLILIRMAEFRLKMAEARRLELENEQYEHDHGEHTHKNKKPREEGTSH